MTRSQTSPDSPETRIPPLGGRRPRRAAALSGLMALTVTTSLLTAGPALAQTPAESSPAQGEQAEQARVEPRAARQVQASTPDGSSAERAAASCWEIKQEDPSSTSGTYWLYTPEMAEPAEFYCDQETDGGGWVMIARGRENWKESYNGVGSAEDIAQRPSGPEAFKTAQLPATTVDALLNGQAPEKLEDGIRLRRALNREGRTGRRSASPASAPSAGRGPSDRPLRSPGSPSPMTAAPRPASGGRSSAASAAAMRATTPTAPASRAPTCSATAGAATTW